MREDEHNRGDAKRTTVDATAGSRVFWEIWGYLKFRGQYHVGSRNLFPNDLYYNYNLLGAETGR